MNDHNNKQPQSSQQPAPHTYYADDEISLFDLWRTIMRRKKLVLVVFIVVLVGALLYLLLTKSVYESRATIQVGQIGQTTLLAPQQQSSYIEDIDALQQRLRNEYPALALIQTQRGSAKNILTLTVHARDKDDAEQQLQQITEQLLRDHRSMFNNVAYPFQQRQEALQQQLRDYQTQLSELNILIERMKISEPAQAAILMIEKGNVTREIPGLEDRLVSLQMALSEPQSSPTRQLGNQITPDKPVSPKWNMVLALAMILGLMLGIFAAFFAEFLAKAREPEPKGEEQE